MRTLTLSAPGKNALSSDHMRAIVAAVRDGAGEPLLVTGAGDAFCAGLNLKEVAELDRAGMARFLGLLEEMAAALYDYPGPTVAAVNGHAIAGGCILVLCCDLRLIADDPKIRIGLNEVALGLEYPPCIFEIARHRIAPRAVERVMLEAGLYDPRTALALGLVDEVTSDLTAAARAQLDRLAAHPSAAYRAAKRDLRAGVTRIPEEVQRRFRDEVVPAWVTPEVKARVRATLERRRG